VGLDQFDTTIADLDSFEDLRYPEKVRGWLIHFELARQPSDASGSALKKVRRFQLFTNDLDQLVAELFHRANLNPKFFIRGLSAEGRALLTKENVTGALWG
jgi:hypothetical protein